MLQINGIFTICHVSNLKLPRACLHYLYMLVSDFHIEMFGSILKLPIGSVCVFVCDPK